MTKLDIQSTPLIAPNKATAMRPMKMGRSRAVSAAAAAWPGSPGPSAAGDSVMNAAAAGSATTDDTNRNHWK